MYQVLAKRLNAAGGAVVGMMETSRAVQLIGEVEGGSGLERAGLGRGLGGAGLGGAGLGRAGLFGSGEGGAGEGGELVNGEFGAGRVLGGTSWLAIQYSSMDLECEVQLPQKFAVLSAGLK